MSVLERFDGLARLVVFAKHGMPEPELIGGVCSAVGIGATRLRSLELLGEELGFLERKGAMITATNAGVKFSNYMSVHHSETPESASTAASDFQVCLTLPPAWQSPFRSALGDLVQSTEAAERQVVEAAKSRLIVVAAFLDPEVLQLKLQGVHRPEVSALVLTSDPRLAKRFPEGNWRLHRLFEVLARRFGHVDVFHFSMEGMIVHAKLWVSDGAFFLTSANVSGNSAADNMEVGLYSTEPALTQSLAMVVDTAVGMEGVERLEP